MNPQPHINYEASEPGGKRGIHSRETAANKGISSPKSSTSRCPFPNHIPSFPVVVYWSGSRRANTAPGLQREGPSTPLQRFIQRGFFKPFSLKYQWMSNPQADCCFIHIFLEGFCPCSLQGDWDWMDPFIPSFLLKENQGFDGSACSKAKKFPKTP